ncbi:MAG: signal peptidase I [Nocardioides sp.]
MTLLATTPAAVHKSRTPGGRLRAGLVNLGLAAAVLVALAFLLPSLLGLQRYVIMGGSMSGTYDLGSVVFSEVVPVEDLKVGDVITYVPPADSGIQTLVTHRIADIDGTQFVTKGDANAAVDPWSFQLSSGTQARVVQHAPYVGFAFMALADRSTRMAVIGIPAVIIALMSLAELLRTLRPRREDSATPNASLVSAANAAAADRRPERHRAPVLV